MKAARLMDNGLVIWEQAPDPELKGPGEVLIRTTSAAICGSDLHNIFAATTTETYPCRPGYPGHESVGQVVESSMPGVLPGQVILAVPDLSCAAAFAELQWLPERFVLPLPESEFASDLVLAQQLGTVVYAMKRFWPASSTPPASEATATIIGGGTAGLFFYLILRQLGFGKIVVADAVASRVGRLDRLGADVAVVADGDAVVDATMSATAGEGADLVIEAAGEDDTRRQAFDAVRLDGRVGLFGTPSSLGLAPFPVNTLFRKKPTVECSHSAQHEANLASFRHAVDLISSGVLDVSGVITHRLEPSTIADALQLALHPQADSLKVTLAF